MTVKTLLVKFTILTKFYHPNQNLSKRKLSCANTSLLDTAQKVITALLLMVIMNLFQLQNIKNACMEESTASLVLHADSYTRMKSKNWINRKFKCKKCNHKPSHPKPYTTVKILQNSVTIHMSTHMSMQRVLKMPKSKLSLTLASSQRITRVPTKASVIS